MPRNSDISPLKDSIDAWLKALRIEKKFDSTKIVAEWEQIVGKLISERTETVYIKGKKLFLRVNSAPLKKELQFSKDKLKDLVTEYCNDRTIIEEVVIL